MLEPAQKCENIITNFANLYLLLSFLKRPTLVVLVFSAKIYISCKKVL